MPVGGENPILKPVEIGFEGGKRNNQEFGRIGAVCPLREVKGYYSPFAVQKDELGNVFFNPGVETQHRLQRWNRKKGVILGGRIFENGMGKCGRWYNLSREEYEKNERHKRFESVELQFHRTLLHRPEFYDSGEIIAARYILTRLAVDANRRWTSWLPCPLFPELE